MTARELDEYYATLENTVMVARAVGIKVVKRGEKYYNICCPGHLQRLGKIDNDPSSCRIMPHGGYHCFACGVSKTTRSMIQEATGCSVGEAYELMAKLIGTTYDRSNKAVKRDDVPPVRLTYEEAKAIHLHMPNVGVGEDDLSLYGLYGHDKTAYYELILSQAKDMMGKYQICRKKYGSVKAPEAYKIFDLLGDNFDTSVYGKLNMILTDRIETCEKIIQIFSGAARKEKVSLSFKTYTHN